MREVKGDLVIIGKCSFFQLSRIFSLALLFCFVLIIVYYQFNIFSGVRTCVLGVQVKLCPCRQLLLGTLANHVYPVRVLQQNHQLSVLLIFKYLMRYQGFLIHLLKRNGSFRYEISWTNFSVISWYYSQLGFMEYKSFRTKLLLQVWQL